MKRYVKVAGKGDLEPGTGKTVDVRNAGRHFQRRWRLPRNPQHLSARGRFAGRRRAFPRHRCLPHAYEFDVTSGECLTEPVYSVERFEVRVEGDDILLGVEVAVPDVRGAAARAALPEEAR